MLEKQAITIYRNNLYRMPISANGFLHSQISEMAFQPISHCLSISSS